jgi:hypothetical protein
MKIESPAELNKKQTDYLIYFSTYIKIKESSKEVNKKTKKELIGLNSYIDNLLKDSDDYTSDNFDDMDINFFNCLDNKENSFTFKESLSFILREIKKEDLENKVVKELSYLRTQNTKFNSGKSSGESFYFNINKHSNFNEDSLYYMYASPLPISTENSSKHLEGLLEINKNYPSLSPLKNSDSIKKHYKESLENSLIFKDIVLFNKMDKSIDIKNVSEPIDNLIVPIMYSNKNILNFFDIINDLTIDHSITESFHYESVMGEYNEYRDETFISPLEINLTKLLENIKNNNTLGRFKNFDFNFNNIERYINESELNFMEVMTETKK